MAVPASWAGRGRARCELYLDINFLFAKVPVSQKKKKDFQCGEERRFPKFNYMDWAVSKTSTHKPHPTPHSRQHLGVRLQEKGGIVIFWHVFQSKVTTTTRFILLQRCFWWMLWNPSNPQSLCLYVCISFLTEIQICASLSSFLNFFFGGGGSKIVFLFFLFDNVKNKQQRCNRIKEHTPHRAV